MSFMVLGYLFGVFFIPKYLSQQKALLLSAIGGYSPYFADTYEF